ncbi:MAG: DUF192 domain-containing protein [Methanothrix sp.]
MLNFIRKRLKYSTGIVEIGGIKLNAILADSFIKKAIGLMYRDEIPEDECMLFTFSHPSMLGIWMKGMRFPIDILWLDSSQKIVTLKESLPPCRSIFCKTYYPERESMYVIELHAGFIKKNSVTNLTEIKIEKPKERR